MCPERTRCALAGAGGFEPPYGGIKIHCLTTWRRPNGRRTGEASSPELFFGNAGLQRQLSYFNRVDPENPVEFGRSTGSRMVGSGQPIRRRLHAFGTDADGRVERGIVSWEDGLSHPPNGALKP